MDEQRRSMSSITQAVTGGSGSAETKDERPSGSTASQSEPQSQSRAGGADTDGGADADAKKETVINK